MLHMLNEVIVNPNTSRSRVITVRFSTLPQRSLLMPFPTMLHKESAAGKIFLLLLLLLFKIYSIQCGSCLHWQGRQFINAALPSIFPKPNHPKYHAIRPSCRKTANTTPPKTIASLPIETLLTLLSLKNLAPHLNATYMVPKAETTHEIWVEADVERAMHLYLVNGINLILEVFPNVTSRLLCRSEVGS